MSQNRGEGTAPGHLLTRLGVYTANPLAFLMLVVYAALVFKPKTFEWHAVATLATWAMTLVIQRAEHRDTQAIHAKLMKSWMRSGTPEMKSPGWMRRSPRRSSESKAHAQGRRAQAHDWHPARSILRKASRRPSSGGG
jgi:hypothetical protein